MTHNRSQNPIISLCVFHPFFAAKNNSACTDHLDNCPHRFTGYWPRGLRRQRPKSRAQFNTQHGVNTRKLHHRRNNKSYHRAKVDMCGHQNRQVLVPSCQTKNLAMQQTRHRALAGRCIRCVWKSREKEILEHNSATFPRGNCRWVRIKHFDRVN